MRVVVLLTGLWGAPVGGEGLPEEVGFLDLATAERSPEDLGVSIASLAGVTGLTPVPAFRLTFEPSGTRSARAGDAIELVVRLESISGERLAIPWEANWKRVLGEVPGKEVKEFPEGYMYATLGSWVESAAESEERIRLPFYGQIYGCLCRPGTDRFLPAASRKPRKHGEWRRSRTRPTRPFGLEVRTRDPRPPCPGGERSRPGSWLRPPAADLGAVSRVRRDRDDNSDEGRAGTPQARWRRELRDGAENHTMVGRAEYVDREHGLASTFACSSCCPDSFSGAWASPAGILLPITSYETLNAFQQRWSGGHWIAGVGPRNGPARYGWGWKVGTGRPEETCRA